MKIVTDLLLAITSLTAICVSVWLSIRYRKVTDKLQTIKVEKNESEVDSLELNNFKSEIEIINMTKDTLKDMHEQMSNVHKEQIIFFEKQKNYLEEQWNRQNTLFDGMRSTIDIIEGQMNKVLSEIEVIKNKYELMEKYLDGPFKDWLDKNFNVK